MKFGSAVMGCIVLVLGVFAVPYYAAGACRTGCWEYTNVFSVFGGVMYEYDPYQAYSTYRTGGAPAGALTATTLTYRMRVYTVASPNCPDPQFPSLCEAGAPGCDGKGSNPGDWTTIQARRTCGGT